MSDPHIERLAASVERILKRINLTPLYPHTRPAWTDFAGLAIVGEQLRRGIAIRQDTAADEGRTADIDSRNLVTMAMYSDFLWNYEFIDGDLTGLRRVLAEDLEALEKYAESPRRTRYNPPSAFPRSNVGEDLLIGLEETVSVIAAVYHAKYPDPEDFLCVSGIDELMRAVGRRVSDLAPRCFELANFAEARMDMYGPYDHDAASIYSFLWELAELSDRSMKFQAGLARLRQHKRQRVIAETVKVFQANHDREVN